MTHDDAVRLIRLLVVAYPNYDKFRDETHLRNTIDLWKLMFADDDAKLISLAVEKHIATSKWPPSIAEIRELLMGITAPGLIPPDEAWAAVNKLLHLHENLYDPTTNYLPAIIAEAVDAVGYDQLRELNRAAARGQSSKVGLDRVAFYQAYEARLNRERERASLPSGLRHKLEQAQQQFSDGSAECLLRLEKDYQKNQHLHQSNNYAGLLTESTRDSGDSE